MSQQAVHMSHQVGSTSSDRSPPAFPSLPRPTALGWMIFGCIAFWLGVAALVMHFA
jgi:uncharacterized protein (DUF2236 family)